MKSTGQWSCFLCGELGTGGTKGFYRHFDVWHVGGDE